MKRFISVLIAITFFINTIGNADPIGSIGTCPALNPFSNEIIKNLFIPECYGTITERWNNGNNKKFIINIQDAHCNYEAQHNISRILEVLVRNYRDYGLDLVGVEGAKGDLDLGKYGKYKDEKAKGKALDLYVKKGYVTGPEYLNITKYNKLPFGIYGIEDGELYLENFISFRETWGNMKEIEYFIDEITEIIEELKKRIYSKELLEFDKKCSEYEGNKISLIEFIGYLSNQKPVTSNQKPDPCPAWVPRRNQKNFNLILRLIELEKEIDFNIVEKEREGLLRELKKNLPREGLGILIKISLEYRLGKIPHVEYYKYLGKYIHTHHLHKYIHLLKLKSKIDSDGLFNEIEEIIRNIKGNLFQNEIQRRLDSISYKMRILKKLFNLELSRNELDYYERNKGGFDISEIIDFIKIQCGIYNINVPNLLFTCGLINKIRGNLLPASNFYRIAIVRDKALVENLLLKMDMENKDNAVIITGGFHTNGVTRFLKEKGIGYIVITPKITKKQLGNPYLSIMLDERIRYLKSGDLTQDMLAPPEIIAPNNGIDELDLKALGCVREKLRRLIESFMNGEINKEEFRKRAEDIKLTEEEISLIRKVIAEIEKSGETAIGVLLRDIFGLLDVVDVESLLNDAESIYLDDKTYPEIEERKGRAKLILNCLKQMDDEVVARALVDYIKEIKGYSLTSPQVSFIYFLIREVIPLQKKNVIGSILSNLYRLGTSKKGKKEDLRLGEGILNILLELINCIGKLNYKNLKETEEIFLRDLLEKGKLRISLSPNIISHLSESELGRYFDIDGDIIYFKEDFFNRLKGERDEGLLKKMEEAIDYYKKEIFNILAMQNICIHLMRYDKKGDFIKSTISKLEKDSRDIEARIFTISILLGYGKRNLSQGNCSRIIKIIDNIYRKTNNSFNKDKLMDSIRIIAEISNSLEEQKLIMDLIKEEMDNLIKLINDIGIKLKEGKEDFRKIRKEQLVLMKEMELCLEILALISKKALLSENIESQSFGNSLLGYMLGMVEEGMKEKWDSNISAEIMSNLGYFIGIGQDKVFSWFLNRLEPNITNINKGEEILNILTQGKINERTAYLILYRNNKNWGFLEDIIYSQKIDIRYRIYAFTWYVLGFLDEEQDMGKFQKMIDCLKDGAEEFVKGVTKDNARIEKLIDDMILQDEEAKVYVMAAILMLQKQVLGNITSKGFLEIARIISNTRVRGYWVNANANFILGGRDLLMAV